MAITATYEIAQAAGQDVGNASMRKARRTAWNYTDWHAASTAMAELWRSAHQDDQTSPAKALTAVMQAEHWDRCPLGACGPTKTAAYKLAHEALARAIAE